MQRAVGDRLDVVHNSQPWRFAPHADRIELHFDPAKRLRATDPESRELRLSCGAALLNVFDSEVPATHRQHLIRAAESGS